MTNQVTFDGLVHHVRIPADVLFNPFFFFIMASN
jgi:hypothetical protein